jgi:hypothetical protein
MHERISPDLLKKEDEMSRVKALKLASSGAQAMLQEPIKALQQQQQQLSEAIETELSEDLRTTLYGYVYDLGEQQRVEEHHAEDLQWGRTHCVEHLGRLQVAIEMLITAKGGQVPVSNN